MPKCRLCDRSGWFLSLTDKGLCKTCAPIVGVNISQLARIIMESINIVNTSKKLDTQLSRCDVIISRAQGLLPYESRNIPTIKPHPTDLINEFTHKRDNLILFSLDRDLAATVDKIPSTKNHKTIINQLNKILLKIQKYESQLKNLSLLDQVRNKTSDKIRDLTFKPVFDMLGGILSNIVNSSPLWDDYRSLLASISPKTKAMMKEKIMEALGTGCSIRQLSYLLDDISSISHDENETIAWTELARVQVRDNFSSYLHSGVVVGKKWLADPDACAACLQNASSGPIRLDDLFPSGDPAPPAHPKCRCDLLPVLDGEM